MPFCLELPFGARKSRTEAHPRLPEKICHHIYSETTELVQTGRPRARNGENKGAKIEKTLIFRAYPRHTQTDRGQTGPADPPPHAGNLHPVGADATGCAPPTPMIQLVSQSAISVLPLPSRTPCPPPAARPRWPPLWTGCDPAHDCFVPEPAVSDCFGSILVHKSPFA